MSDIEFDYEKFISYSECVGIQNANIESIRDLEIPDNLRIPNVQIGDTEKIKAQINEISGMLTSALNIITSPNNYSINDLTNLRKQIVSKVSEWEKVESGYQNPVTKPNFLMPVSPVRPDGSFPIKLSFIPDPEYGITFLKQYGLDAFPIAEVDGARTFYTVINLLSNGQIFEAKNMMDDFWRKYPTTNVDAWGRIPKPSPVTSTIEHSPQAALVMLKDIVDWWTRKNLGQVPNYVVRPMILGVVTQGVISGILPRTFEELVWTSGDPSLVRAATKGENNTTYLDPRFTANFHESTRWGFWLFSEYIYAMTDGRLQMYIKPYIQQDPTIFKIMYDPSKTRGERGALSLILEPNQDQYNRELDAVRTFDMTLFLTPTVNLQRLRKLGVPGFGSGGAGFAGGKSSIHAQVHGWMIRPFATIAEKDKTTDDIVLRRPTELIWSLADFIWHEWAHTVNWLYPEIPIEKKGHDYFDRTTWPPDFVGQTQHEYFSEFMKKRLLIFGTGVMELTKRLLRHDPSPAELKGITLDYLLGKYFYNNVKSYEEQNVHWRGQIEKYNKSPIVWHNDANAYLNLYPQVDAQGNLLSINVRRDDGGVFYFVLERDAEGNYLPVCKKFVLDASTYVKVLP